MPQTMHAYESCKQIRNELSNTNPLLGNTSKQLSNQPTQNRNQSAHSCPIAKVAVEMLDRVPDSRR